MDDLSSPNAQNLHIYMNRYVFKGGLFLSDKKLTEDKFDNHRLTKFLPLSALTLLHHLIRFKDTLKSIKLRS
ncbi:hypothetical protein CHR37_05555 [Bacillus velezensis]|nr:hypothetical protein CHR37_05555 [Bacillus velezensis]